MVDTKQEKALLAAIVRQAFVDLSTNNSDKKTSGMFNKTELQREDAYQWFISKEEEIYSSFGYMSHILQLNKSDILARVDQEYKKNKKPYKKSLTR